LSTATELELAQGKVVRIVGPARVEVVEGKLLVVGSRYSAGSSFVVHRLRSYSAKALEYTKLRLVLGGEARVEEVSPSDEVVDAWLSVAEQITPSCYTSPCKILVVGPPESGKTTMVAFLANYSREAGLRVAVVEGDVGQEDLLVPATVALAEVSRPVLWLRELEPLSFRFVGCISPQYCFAESILAIKDLVDEALTRGFNVVVVNTDGWVGSPSAIEHKLALARWVKPTHIVTLSEELFEVFSRCFGSLCKVLRAPRPPAPRERSREERRELRAQAYRKYIGSGRVRNLKLSNLSIVSSGALAGSRVGLEEVRRMFNLPDNLVKNVLHAFKVLNTYYLIWRGDPTPLKDFTPSAGVRLLRAECLEGLLVGILDCKMRDVGVGVLVSIDFDTGDVGVQTPWEGEVCGLILGKVKLSETLEEVGGVRCSQ
jgi:polynucleotide 5'-hydroxyl-kinase GRC3/NOL9